MGKLFADLRRRRVFRVAAVYAVAAWLLIQVVTAIETPLSLPDWFDTIVIVLLAMGFPLAVLFAWVFDLTPDGIKITGTDPPVEMPQAGSTLDYALGALLLVVLGFMTAQQFDLFDAEEGIETTVGTDQVAETPALVEEPASPTIESSTPIDNMSIAVLVLRNESPDPDNEYFAAGIHEAILNQLAKISALQVKSRTTVLRYADSDLNTVEIARELGVGSVMEGSVRFAGNDVRISLQLIDAMDDVHLWSDEYTREFEEIFAIESDVAIQVADALQATLLPAELARIERPATESAEAYNLFLQHRYQMEQEGAVASGSEDDYISLGIPRLERAIDLDPQFAVAIAELGFLKFFRSNLASNPAERDEFGDEAIRLANQAIEIDTTITRAYLTLAGMAMQRRQWNEMDSYYLEALDLPDLDGRTALNFANELGSLGRLEESKAWYDVAISRAPTSAFFRNLAVTARFVGRDYTTALELLEGFRATGGNEIDYHTLRAYALNRLDRQAESLNELRQVPEEPTFGSSETNLFHNYLRCQLGERDSVMEEQERLMMESPNPDNYLGIIYCAAGAGEVDEMFGVIQRWLRSSAPRVGLVMRVFNLEEVRSDPRSQDMEAYMNLPAWD